VNNNEEKAETELHLQKVTSILLGPIYRTLEGCDFLSFSDFISYFLNRSVPRTNFYFNN
jgi:hypothetical protein